MLQAHHRTFTTTIAAVDLLLLATALLLGGVWPEGAPAPSHGALVEQGVIAIVAWLIVAARLALYHSRRTEHIGRELQAIAEACVLTLGLTSLGGLVLHGRVPFHPAVTCLVAILLIAAERLVVRALLRGLRVRGYNYRYAVIAGRGRSAAVFAETVLRNRHYGIRLLGTLPLAGETAPSPSGIRDLATIGDVKQVMSEFVVDAVVLCPSQAASAGAVLEVLSLCEVAGVDCHYAPSFFSLRGLHPSVVWYDSLPSFAFQAGPHAPLRLVVKRVVDLVASALGLVVLSPVFLVCALAVKVYDRGPVFFRQMRVGQNGRPFRCFKFRSMCHDAEQQRAQLLARNEETGPAFKLKADPRVTPVGRVLRKYSLDELPQLINVLLGDMSLVGPRPPIPSEVAQYDWWQRRRLSVRPGITCIWQVFGRNRVPFHQWMEMDLEYIDNWSLTMDAKLLARTVGTVVKGTGV